MPNTALQKVSARYAESFALLSCPELGELVVKTRNMIGNFSKAKAAKLIRDLVDRFLDMKSSTGREVCELTT